MHASMPAPRDTFFESRTWVLANIGHGCWQLPTAAAGKTRILASSRDMLAPRTHLDSADVGQFARVLARGCWQQTAFGLRMPARMALRQPGTLWSCVLACWHARLLAIVRRLAVSSISHPSLISTSHLVGLEKKMRVTTSMPIAVTPPLHSRTAVQLYYSGYSDSTTVLR